MGKGCEGRGGSFVKRRGGEGRGRGVKVGRVLCEEKGGVKGLEGMVC